MVCPAIPRILAITLSMAVLNVPLLRVERGLRIALVARLSQHGCHRAPVLHKFFGLACFTWCLKLSIRKVRHIYCYVSTCQLM